MVSAYDARNPEALKRLVAAGAILKPFPQEILNICEKTTFEHYEEIAKTNESFRAVFTLVSQSSV